MSKRVTRRQSMAVVKPPEKPPRVSKKVATSKILKENKTIVDEAEQFVNGESFNFDLKTVSSPRGVMTRARRSSVYFGGPRSKPLRQNKALPSLEEKPEQKLPLPLRRLSMAPEPKSTRKITRSTKKSSKPATITTTATRKRKAKEDVDAIESSPVLGHSKSDCAKGRKLTFEDKSLNEDVQVVLKRLQNTPAKNLVNKEDVFHKLSLMKDTPDRVENVISDIVSSTTESETPSPKKPKPTKTPAPKSNKKKTQKKDVRTLEDQNEEKKETTPAKKLPPPVLKTTTVCGTPQSLEPTSYLRNRMKVKIESEISDRMAKLPPSSPYTLMEGETENGSPSYMFTKLKQRPEKSISDHSLKYVTSTPVIIGSKKRRALGNAENRISELDGKDTPKKVLDFDSQSDGSLCEEKENSTVLSSPEKSPVKLQPQLITGELGKACTIM